MESNVFLSENIKLRGQIIYKTRISKTLCFLRILLEDDKIEEAKVLEENMIKLLKVGQVIELTGTYDEYKGKTLIKVHNIVVFDQSPFNIKYLNNKRKEINKNSEKPLEKRKLCREFRDKKNCMMKDCFLRHFLIEGDEDKIKSVYTQKERDYFNAHEGDHYDSSSKLSKSKRNEEFAKFLVDTFSLEYLKSGYILDIAGGKGIKSF
jgi:hypothetical protein